MKIEMNALRILMRENGQAFRDWVVVARGLKREGSGFSLTGDSIASRLLISGRFSRLRFCQTLRVARPGARFSKAFAPRPHPAKKM